MNFINERKITVKTKKIIASALAMLMTAAALAGCGGNDGGSGKMGSSENKDTVDLARVDGVTLSTDADTQDVYAEIGDVEVAIGDAKLVEQNGEDVAVVEFTFKNNGDAEANFTGVVRAEAYQEGAQLVPTVINGVDGIDMLTLSQNIGKGHQISVDKAYRLRNHDDVIEIQVTEITNGKTTPQAITKYFSIPE